MHIVLQATLSFRLRPRIIQCSDFLSVVLIKYSGGKKLGEEKVYLAHTSNLKPIIERSRGRNSSRNLKIRTNGGLIFWLNDLHLSNFFI